MALGRVYLTGSALHLLLACALVSSLGAASVKGCVLVNRFPGL